MNQKRLKFPERPVQLSIRLLQHERAIINNKARLAGLSVVEYVRTQLGLSSGLEKVESDTASLPDKMIYLNGRQGLSFKCECGCNVFKEYAPLKYICNSCSATYSGDK